MSGIKGSVLDKSEVETSNRPKESKQWALVLWNNDTTPFDVVLDVLIKGLGLEPVQAHNAMLEAHNHDYSIIIKASKSVCEIKKQIAESYCKECHKERPSYRYDHLKFSIEEV